MTLEYLSIRMILFVLLSFALASMNLVQMVSGQNSTSTSRPEQPYSNESTNEDESDASGNGDESDAPDNSTNNTSSQGSDSSTQNANSTDAQTSNDTSESQNSPSTDTSENQTSTTTSDQISGNATDVLSSNSTETGIENNGSSEQQGNSTDSTQPSNTTGTRSENSTTYNITQLISENATISSNANLTDFISVNQTIVSLPPPDFDISVDPITTNIEVGKSVTYSITVSSINNFTSDVSLFITSNPIAGIAASLSSNMTRPPPDSNSIIHLNVQSDPTTPSGKYKLKVTASSANMSDSSTSVTLEVIGKNVTLDHVEQFDPVALTPVLIKDMQDNIVDDISINRMVLISTTVNNNYNKTQPFIIVVEVRDEIGTTLYLQLQKGILNPLGEIEVAISWTPDKAGTYQVRTFAIDEIKEDPEPLSVPVGKTIEIR